MWSDIRQRDSYWRRLERAGRRIASVVVRISVSEIVGDKNHQQPWVKSSQKKRESDGNMTVNGFRNNIIYLRIFRIEIWISRLGSVTE